MGAMAPSAAAWDGAPGEEVCGLGRKLCGIKKKARAKEEMPMEHRHVQRLGGAVWTAKKEAEW